MVVRDCPSCTAVVDWTEEGGVNMADFFPSGYAEALTMLYLQSQDLSSSTPEELAKLYWETYYRISAAGRDTHMEIRDAQRHR